jgi:hypothetical protein
VIKLPRLWLFERVHYLIEIAACRRRDSIIHVSVGNTLAKPYLFPCHGSLSRFSQRRMCFLMIFESVFVFVFAFAWEGYSRATSIWALGSSFAAAAGCLTCPVWARFKYTSHGLFVMESLWGSQMEFWLRASTLWVASVVLYCVAWASIQFPHRGGEDEYLLKLFYFVGIEDLAECKCWIAVCAHLCEDILVA